MNVKQIKEQFDAVIRYSQGINDPQTDELFERWLEAKKDFIEAFNGECIYEYPEEVCFRLDKKAKDNKVSSFIDYIYSINEELSDFIVVNMDGFFSNKTSRSWTAPDGKVIPENTKLIKAFKFFETDPKLLHQFQDRASQIIQEDCVYGKLCFSVHPLDFLSSSLNNYNWRSCHALDGEYRSGNLSYMVDKCTVMCYLKGEDNVNIPLFPEDVRWNDKKWRMLIYLSEDWDSIFCGRPYPFTTESGIKHSTEKLIQVLDVSKKFVNSYLTNTIISHVHDELDDEHTFWLNQKYIVKDCELVSLYSLVKDAQHSLHFNDVLFSSCYTPYYQVSNNYHTPEEVLPSPKPIEVGGEIKCLDCGKEIISETSTMRCQACELEYGTETKYGYSFCDCCGSRIYLDDAEYVYVDTYEEVPVCQHCYNTECVVCEVCGRAYFRADTIYSRTLNGYICEDCKEEQ